MDGAQGLSEGPIDIAWRSFDGLALHAREFRPQAQTGKRPIICIPGLTRNSRDFEDVAPWLAAQGRRVIAVDLRGRGASAYDPRPNNYNPRIYARDIESLLSTLSIPRAHIIGTSLGGIVAMTMALASVDRIAGIVLNDVGPATDQAGVKRIAGYVGKGDPVRTWDDAARAMAHIHGAAFPNSTAADWARFARRSFKPGADGAPLLDYDPNISRRFSPQALKIASMILWRGYKKLARQRPTLILRGELSDILAADTAQRMSTLCPTAMCATIANVGHAPTLDEPDTRAALAAFFALVD